MYWITMALRAWEKKNPNYKAELRIDPSNGTCMAHGVDANGLAGVLIFHDVPLDRINQEAEGLLEETGPHTFAAYHKSRRDAVPYTIELDLLALSPITSVLDFTPAKAYEQIWMELNKNPSRQAYLGKWEKDGCIIRIKED